MHETPCKLGTALIRGRLLLRRCVGWTTTRILAVALCICVSAPITAFAWLYPEHRDITLLALNMLEPEQRSVLEELWSEARTDMRAGYARKWVMKHKGQSPAALTTVRGLPSPAITRLPPRSCLTRCLRLHGFLE